MARRRLVAAGVAAVAVAAAGCSVSRLAVNALGDALAAGGSTYARDDDPELVGQALPFALKTIEGLLDSSPRHRGLLLAAASGFTQYAYAWVDCEADYLETSEPDRAAAMRGRAVRLYRRAHEYGLRGLDVARPGIAAALRRDPAAAAASLGRQDVGLMYWTALPLAAAAAAAKEPDTVAALPAAEALMRRALTLDEAWSAGAIHDFFIAFEGGRPSAAGGSLERARRHFERAMALGGGTRLAPLVSLAETVSVARQDRAEFVALLRQAIAFDTDSAPAERLANLVAQRRARWLLSHADELFID